MNIAANTDDYILITVECKEDSQELRKVFNAHDISLCVKPNGDITGVKLWKKLLEEKKEKSNDN